MSTAGRPDPEYVRARRVLLDALESLAPHGSALVTIRGSCVVLASELLEAIGGGIASAER